MNGLFFCWPMRYLYQPVPRIIGLKRYDRAQRRQEQAQPALITAVINRLSAVAGVIITTGNDEGGNSLAEQIKALVAATQRPQRHVSEDRPPTRG